MAQPERRTGIDYLNSLGDGRRVYLDGVRLASISDCGEMMGMARTLASLYEHPLVSGGAGPHFHPMWDAAGSAAALREKGAWYRAVATLTGGLLGRSPDFLAAIVTAWQAHADHFGDRSAQVREFWSRCRQGSLVLAHAISDPPAVRAGTRPASLLQVVGRRPGGIIVRGLKMLATLGPYADVMLVYPYRPLDDHEADAALCFALPMATEGLTLHARAPMAASNGPLSRVFDESDAIVEFEDVFVPDEWVFIDGCVRRANLIRSGTHMTTFAWHQSVARVWAKTRWMAESARRAGRMLNKSAPATMAKIADLYATARILDALMKAAENDAVESRPGVFMCEHSALSVAVTHYSSVAEKQIETLADILGSALVIRPDHFGGVDPGGLMGRFYDAQDAADVSLDMTLAHELTSTPFGRRQILYEKAFVGPPESLRAREADAYAKGEDLVLPYFTQFCQLDPGGKYG